VFYFLSKTLSVLINTAFVHGVLLTTLFVLLFIKRTRGFALIGLTVVTGFSILITVVPVGTVMSRSLETRFAKPDLATTEFSGVVTLAGVLDPNSYLQRGDVYFGDSSDRIFYMLRIANLYPQMPVIFAGGDGNLTERGFSEADVLREWLSDSTLLTENMHFEPSSRNTHESATLSRQFAQDSFPEIAEKPWLLITSAQHMPRAVGTFRQAGWTIIPYPVDRKTSDTLHLASLNVSSGITSLGRGLHEWVGLTAYYWTGRTNEWFPGPVKKTMETEN
jgi:uncharacterized SAM-binding protein YcdF (DUF218 family)